MSLLIEGMEMPKTCGDCPCANIFGCTCMAAKRTFDKYPFENREDWCPLINVPEPHGRLGDLDALIEAMARMVPLAIADPTANTFLDGLSAAYEAIQAAPTIIDAEKGET